MSLISCPDCGKRISDQAFTCVGCGWPVDINASNIESKSTEESVSGLGCAVTLVGIIGAISAGIYFEIITVYDFFAMLVTAVLVYIVITIIDSFK
jgi:hypothetical protein